MKTKPELKVKWRQRKHGAKSRATRKQLLEALRHLHKTVSMMNFMEPSNPAMCEARRLIGGEYYLPTNRGFCFKDILTGKQDEPPFTPAFLKKAYDEKRLELAESAGALELLVASGIITEENKQLVKGCARQLAEKKLKKRVGDYLQP